MTEKYALFMGKLKSSMVIGLVFPRMRQAAALGKRFTYTLWPCLKKKAIGNERQEWNGRQEWRRGDSCVEMTWYKSKKTKLFAEEEKALEERKGSKVK